MLTLLLYMTLVILGTAISGLVLAPFLVNKLVSQEVKRGAVTLAVAVVIGFTYSNLAATWSFGALGANSYVYVYLVLGFISLLPLASKTFRATLKIWKEFTKNDFTLIGIPLLAVFLAKPYWANLSDMRIAAGIGPDIPQNLMTALAQHNVGSTWFAGRDQFLHFVGSSNLNQAVYHLYQLPSMQEQAGVDYLIYGTRWGLSIPFAQFLRLDPRNLILGQGLSIAVGLVALGLIMYSFTKIMNLRPMVSILLTIASISSSSFLFQAYNGGMAQAWGLAGLGILLSLIHI